MYDMRLRQLAPIRRAVVDFGNLSAGAGIERDVSACAACGRSVRNFNGRTVCDGCGAVLIPHAVFVDLFRGDVDLIDDTPTERRCPCCNWKMRSCRIAIDGVDLDHDTLYCPDDGVWLAGGLLEHILYATERETHRDFPARGKSHIGPGLFDLEREEARIRVITTLRTWSYLALLSLGFLFSFGAVVAAGWWCVAFMVVAAIVIRWYLRRGLVTELGLLFLRPLTYCRALVRWRRSLPAG